MTTFGSSPSRDEEARRRLHEEAVRAGDENAERFTAASVWSGLKPETIDAGERSRRILNAIYGREVIPAD